MTVTPSMDDKDTPSPPVRTTEKYERDKAAGIERIGSPGDRKSVEETQHDKPG
ncbi:hypothetical protein NKG99_20515 [Mesorhizobium sp. M1409]|uniref:hypothetical protein n=1 Tax=Mesorhizobium sp. M1409 TaxID=2957100 RepID=UPI00333A8689